MNERYLGVEFGSTRIKALALDAELAPLASGDYHWASRLEGQIWTYELEEAWRGFRAALEALELRAPEALCAAGVSGMMHGYLAFDEDWNLLCPFRTWQNTMTAEAAAVLTERFGVNVPQRWSVAHLYQAILNGGPHVAQIAHLTTLAGYIHFMLTSEHVVGLGEASGIFPLDGAGQGYDERLLDAFDALARERGFSRSIRALLPRPLRAGQEAGRLTEEGARRLNGLLKPGLPFAPPEGDAGTGMVASNAVAPRSGNVSAGTSIFSMLVLERPLRAVYSEIDPVATPVGDPVAMVHCNNGSNEINAWVELFRELLALEGCEAGADLYGRLFRKALEGEPDCGGLLLFNYLAGEGVTHLDEGCPLLVRRAESRFTLANLMRAQLYASLATLRLGLDILRAEGAPVDALTGHGGFFKTPGVGQRVMAAACETPVVCMATAGEGGPYGMALLAAYRDCVAAGDGPELEDFLNERVFAAAEQSRVEPDPADVRGFRRFLARYKRGLALQDAALAALKEEES